MHLQPGDTVDWAHLRRPVALDDEFTLGAVCEALDRMAPGARAALEAVLGYPLAPWLDDCLRTAPPADGSDNGLVEIRLRWCCESWGGPSPAGWSPTVVRLDVFGIGPIWAGFRPGEPHHRPGDDEPRHYALDFTPLATLRPLPAPDTTLLALLTALFDEFTYYGSPEARDQEFADLLREDEEPEEGGNITLQQLREELEARRRLDLPEEAR